MAGNFSPDKALFRWNTLCISRKSNAVWREKARHLGVLSFFKQGLVPQDHILRKIEKVMDYEWLYERLSPYYCHDNGRPGADPVVFIKMVLIQHLFGIPSLRQTYREIQVNLAYRWFLGYGLLDQIPHFATVSYAFCKRFPPELSEEIFEHILTKALNNRMAEPSMIFIDGTHIKASANKKKFQKQKVSETAKIYSEQLRQEVNEERAKLGKKPVEDDDDDDDTPGNGTREKTVSTTDPDCGMFVKEEHERQFAYEAHTACDKHGIVLGVEVTAGNVHDSVAWDKVYDDVTSKFEVKFVAKETIERVFADAKEKHAMRYIHHRGLARVTNWVRLKYAAMNLKKIAIWSWKFPSPSTFVALFMPLYARTPILAF